MLSARPLSLVATTVVARGTDASPVSPAPAPVADRNSGDAYSAPHVVAIRDASGSSGMSESGKSESGKSDGLGLGLGLGLVLGLGRELGLGLGLGPNPFNGSSDESGLGLGPNPFNGSSEAWLGLNAFAMPVGLADVGVREPVEAASIADSLDSDSVAAASHATASA